ncbi:MAG TPA: HisA/HisF-related TIM barrel protein [Vicinamibacterales bacterium]|nr:HisA/HisF-related TIM barrel protein [Vicinamibacterales bacterium]
MRVVGVIDVVDGRAVHAVGGRRSGYQPVRSAAGRATDGDPLALARAYVEAFDLRELYMADLDAIAGASPQTEVVSRLAATGASLWVDAAVAGPDAALRLLSNGAAAVVVGLETLPSFDALDAISHAVAPRQLVFSLDLKDGVPVVPAGFEMRGAAGPGAPEAIAARAVDHGAGAVIVLDLARVGTDRGPDLDLVCRVRGAVPDVELYAGGGVRSLDDLRNLAGAGCDGALVATALHAGRLTGADVAALRARAAAR